MMKRLAAFLLCALSVPAAFACGVCVDDKVASAYDHAVVQQAWKSGKVVVFCELLGPYPVEKLTQEAQAAAGNLRGVNRASVRTGRSMAVVSFVLDVTAQSPTDATEKLAQQLRSRDISPRLLKVLKSKSDNKG